MMPDLSLGRFFRPVRIALHGCDTFFGLGLVWVHYGYHATMLDIALVCFASMLLQAGSGCIRHIMRWQILHELDTTDRPTRLRLGELFSAACLCFGMALLIAMSRGMDVLVFAGARAALGVLRGVLGMRLPLVDGMLTGCIRACNIAMGIALYPMAWGVMHDAFLLLPVLLVVGVGFGAGVLETVARDRWRDAIFLVAFLILGATGWCVLLPEVTIQAGAMLPFVCLMAFAGGAAVVHPAWHSFFVRSVWGGGVLLQGALLVYLAQQQDEMRFLVPSMVCLLPALAALLPSGFDSQNDVLDVGSFVHIS